MRFKEALINSKNLGIEATNRIRSNGELAARALSSCAFVTAIPKEITTTASLLPLEPWQIIVIKGGIVAFASGTYLLNMASTLNANQGRDRGHRILGNLGLAASGAATAAFDVIAITAPL